MDFLDEILDEDQISTGDSDLDEHSKDWGTPDWLSVKPDVVVWPESEQDVSDILSEAYKREVPVTPFALGTSLEGHATPVNKGICMDLTRMDEILEFRPENFQVDVQPGVVGTDVNEHTESRGLFFPPLPSSGDISTIGGMIANDASGMKTVRYGEVHDWIMKLRVALPDGAIINTGSLAKKTSSGYNLKDLFVGSEGTLGIITRATLRLKGIPEQVRGGRVLFETLDDASAAVSDVIQSGVDVAAIELIDPLSARMVNEYLDLDLPDVPMVFLEFHANHGIQDEIDFARTIFESHSMKSFEMAENENDMETLWKARRELAFAVVTYRNDLEPLHPGDITVPINKYPEMISYIKELGEEHDLLIPCFGHAGDGNVHYTIMVKSDDDDHFELGEQVYEEVIDRALSFGGTCTGEHGIGRGKRHFLEREHGQSSVRAMQMIKEALDPKMNLNPGKIFTDEYYENQEQKCRS